MELLWYTKRCERRMTHANLDKSGGLDRRTGGCGRAGLHCRGEGWAMISENDKNEMCRMRRLGFTLDYIAKATGYSASSVANATACVERPLASSGKDKQIEAMIHKLVRYRPPGAGVQREKSPCEHCQWRMNKEDPVVCGVCYREAFRNNAVRKT